MMGVQLDLDDEQLGKIQKLIEEQGEALYSQDNGLQAQNAVLDSAVWRVR